MIFFPLQELMDSRQAGAERLSRVETLAPTVKKNSTASGCEQMEAEIQGLQADWKQWEESVCQSQNTLEALLSQMAISEQEFSSGVSKLEDAVQDFSVLLGKWSQKLMQGEGKNTDKEIVEAWHRQKVTLYSYFILMYLYYSYVTDTVIQEKQIFRMFQLNIWAILPVL